MNWVSSTLSEDFTFRHAAVYREPEWRNKSETEKAKIFDEANRWVYSQRLTRAECFISRSTGMILFRQPEHLTMFLVGCTDGK